MNSPIELRRYCTKDGLEPFTRWLERLEVFVAKRILVSVNRMGTGNIGGVKAVGGGVLERRLDFGPGYRVYFLRDGAAVVILLCGGDKGSQEADIRRAHAYAADYWRRR